LTCTSASGCPINAFVVVDDEVTRNVSSDSVMYINGMRMTTDGDTKAVVTKRDSQGRPTQVKETCVGLDEEAITDITYHKDGGRTEKSSGKNVMYKSTATLVYDKNGNLVSGKIISTYVDNEITRKLGRVGHYIVSTYRNGKWYVQSFDENGKAISKEISAEELEKRTLKAIEQMSSEPTPNNKQHANDKKSVAYKKMVAFRSDLQT